MALINHAGWRCLCGESDVWLAAGGRGTEHVLINVRETPRALHEDTRASPGTLNSYSAYKLFRCLNNNFRRVSRQFAFVIWTFKSAPVTSAPPVFKTTCKLSQRLLWIFFSNFSSSTLCLCHIAVCGGFSVKRRTETGKGRLSSPVDGRFWW